MGVMEEHRMRPTLNGNPLRFVTQQGYSVAEAAKNLGVNAGLLRGWKTEMGQQGTGAFPGKGHKRGRKRNCIACERRTGDSGWNRIF